MRSPLPLPSAARLGLAGLALAVELATAFVPNQPALAAGPTQPSQTSTTTTTPASHCDGPADYPVAGGWFYTEEAARWPCIVGYGPARARGFLVVDDAEAYFWTEFRRFGGVDVLGYPVSQRYHYPADGNDGYVYQAFERGILQWHPETGRAEMANVFEQFTRQGLDDQLETFGIPRPQADAGPGPGLTADQRMDLLTQPEFLARFFFNPVAWHSSEPTLEEFDAVVSEEQAWTFFGLPQSPAQQLSLRGPNGGSLYPLAHTFIAQRFQKAGMQLFLENGVRETFVPTMHLDPTIVPGDGVSGCVALTAVGLLARDIGANKMIPTDMLQPLPPDPSPVPFFQPAYVPKARDTDTTITFELVGSGFRRGSDVTINFTQGKTVSDPPRELHDYPVYVKADDLGSFDTTVSDIDIGIYTVTASGFALDGSPKVTRPKTLNLSVPVSLDGSQSAGQHCKYVGLNVDDN